MLNDFIESLYESYKMRNSTYLSNLTEEQMKRFAFEWLHAIEAEQIKKPNVYEKY